MKTAELSEDNVNEIAKALEAFTLSLSLTPDMTGYTDTCGTVTFSPLKTGLYLAVPECVFEGAFMYSADPLIAEITDGSETVLPKIYKSIVAGSGVVSRTVKKVWLDSGNVADAPPVSVTVELYKDGQMADTVVLNESNDWKHRWSGLDNRYSWRVAEKDVPEGYTVLIDYNSTQFLIKNTLDEDSMTTVTTTTGTGVTTNTSVTSNTPDGLPQTGQPWTPVFALSICGVVFITAGHLLRHRTADEEKIILSTLFCSMHSNNVSVVSILLR